MRTAIVFYEMISSAIFVLLCAMITTREAVLDSAVQQKRICTVMLTALHASILLNELFELERGECHSKSIDFNNSPPVTSDTGFVALQAYLATYGTEKP
jgi:hypothetical protein